MNCSVPGAPGRKGCHESGEKSGLKLKADALGRKLPFEHTARQMRAGQLRRIIKTPALLDDIARDLRRTHILFSQLEHVRVALAKHEVGGKKNSLAHAPGLALFNRWNGSFEYEIAYEGAILSTLSRRDIAESSGAFRYEQSAEHRRPRFVRSIHEGASS